MSSSSAVLAVQRLFAPMLHSVNAVRGAAERRPSFFEVPEMSFGGDFLFREPSAIEFASPRLGTAPYHAMHALILSPHFTSPFPADSASIL
ncbi:hypothetical protein B0H10DRAFT_2228252 [Mycena sp. CBHHK59/15]|nr:hypothetical protein B0H10DRAFT_2228252 [Mycena sp. CBHHK59/15]